MNSIKYLRSICLILFLGLLWNCSNAPALDDLVGKWKGKFHGTDFILTFRHDDNFIIKAGDLTEAGEFKADFSESPIKVAIKNRYNVNEKIIIEFIDEDHIRMESGGPDNPFPEEFHPERSFILRRVVQSE